MNTENKFLIDCLVENLAIYLMEDDNLPLIEALNIVYNSQLYEKILDLSTGLYYQSAAYNYNLLRKEIKFGKIA